MKDFAGKTVVITGAGSGIGRAFAMKFADLGAKLALNDHDVERLRETHELVHTKYQNCQIFTCDFDVADRLEMQRFAVEVQSLIGSAHVLVNNAGIRGAAKPFYAMAPDDFQRTMNVNFNGVVNGTLAFLPQLIKQSDAALVNISSIYGLLGIPNNSDYCASKFAIRGFTEALMVEFHKTPVEIYGVYPGGAATNIVNGAQYEAYKAKYLTTPPDKLVNVVLKGMARKQPNISYGNSSLAIRFAVQFLPRRLLNKLLWNEMQQFIDPDDYAKFS